LHFQTKHTDLALKDFEKANQLRPFQNKVLFNLGNSYMVLGKQEEACKNWQMADSLGYEEAKLMVLKFCKSGILNEY
jgi:tetratricopeptide (TPR) repeat protein